MFFINSAGLIFERKFSGKKEKLESKVLRFISNTFSRMINWFSNNHFKTVS